MIFLLTFALASLYINKQNTITIYDTINDLRYAALIDAGTLRGVGVGALLVAALQLLVATHGRVGRQTDLAARDEHAQTLLELPATCLANRFVASQRLGQHEGTEHAQQLNKGHRGGTGGNQHGALRQNKVHLAEAAVLEGFQAIVLLAVVELLGNAAAAGERHHDIIGVDMALVLVVRVVLLPVVGTCNTTAAQLKG